MILLTENILIKILILMFSYSINSCCNDIMIFIIERVDLSSKVKTQLTEVLTVLKHALLNTHDIFHVKINDRLLTHQMMIEKELRQLSIDGMLKRNKNIVLEDLFVKLEHKEKLNLCFQLYSLHCIDDLEERS